MAGKTPALCLPLLFSLVAMASTAQAAQQWPLDSNNIDVRITTTAFGIMPVNIGFRDVTGTLRLAGADYEGSGVQVEIDMHSIRTGSTREDEQFCSAQWFDCTRFPVSSFRSIAVERTGAQDFEVTGDIVIRGNTGTVTFDVQWQDASGGDGSSGARRPEEATTLLVTGAAPLAPELTGLKGVVEAVSGPVMIRFEARLERKNAQIIKEQK